MLKVNNKEYNSPIEAAVDVIAGKWKIYILWNLQDAPKRNSELLKAIPNISQKMLTQKLRELEYENIIERKVYPVVPPKVEYSLTKFGNKLKPLMMMLYQWGEDYVEEFKS